MSPASGFKSNPYQFFLADLAFVQRKTTDTNIQAACALLIATYKEKKEI